MFQIDSNKSPGPDGYCNGFYKAAWKIMGQDVTEAAMEFFQNRQLLKQLNIIVITLIPYKCISKLICNRLKVAVNQLVAADNQYALVQGRSMLHNVLICHDILEALQ
ncbi:uncharacterized protein [Nicotiana sylvestris]|uniref:uncharacterized protein n=1 Tax=Nicotiana sylvestris TaxID=4096 RepID=UPI00388C790E